MAANPGGGPRREVDLALFQAIAAEMEALISKDGRSRNPTEEEMDAEESIQFPERLGGVEAWPGVDLRDYNLTEPAEAPPTIILPQAAGRRLVPAEFQLAPAGVGGEAVSARPGMNQHGGLRMMEERERIPESYEERHMYKAAPERRRFLIPSAQHTEVKTGLKKASRRLQHFNCVFMQPLGWGGEGFAALYEHTMTNGNTRKVVAKAHYNDRPLDPRRPALTRLSIEAKKMREFIGSAHTVQPLGPAGFGHSAFGDAFPSPPDWEPVLMMEYCARGSFDNVLRRAARADAGDPRQTLDNRTLWSIFECLFRSIMALRYPQRYWSDWRGPPNDEYANNPIRDEEIPMRTVNGIRTAMDPDERHIPPEHNGHGRRWMSCPKDWYNVDMDPQNFLVGDFTGGTTTAAAHTIAPVLKMNDFGFLHDLNGPEYRASSRRPLNQIAWLQRTEGKKLWRTPEQFSTEWMYCTPRAQGGLEDTKVAGQYGWKTNLYSIGQMMWSLISHCQQPRGRVPWKIRVRFAPPPGAPPPPPAPAPAPAAAIRNSRKRKSRTRDIWAKRKKRRYQPLPNPPPDPNNTLGPNEEFQWSYGGYLLQENDPAFTNVDRELRELVVRCMMELPRDRPDLEELEDIFKAKLGPGPPPPRPGGDGGDSNKGPPPPPGAPPGGPPPGEDDDSDGDDDSGGTPPTAARPQPSAFARRVFRDPPSPVHYAADALRAWLRVPGLTAGPATNHPEDLFEDPAAQPLLSDRPELYSTEPPRDDPDSNASSNSSSSENSTTIESLDPVSS